MVPARPRTLSHQLNGYKMLDLVGIQGGGTRCSELKVIVEPRVGNESPVWVFTTRVRPPKPSHPGDRSHRQEGHPTLVTQRPPYTLHGGNTLSA